MATPQNTETQPRGSDLFAQIEQAFKTTSLGDDRWYIMAAAAIVGSSDPELCKDLYLYLISLPAFSTSEKRQYLIRRLREVFVKSVSIVGVCKPLEAIMVINSVEREEDKDLSSTREGWQCDEANLERGMDWLGKIYTRNTDDTMALFDDHKDFAWISKRITYGLYLSDRQILDDVETELVVLPGIMIQNLPNETSWHIRGTRRIGVSKEDVQVICDCVHLVAKFVGLTLNRVPSVDAVESQV